jgi:chromosome segregation protein
MSDSNAQQQLQETLLQKQQREQALAEARNVLEHATLTLNKLEQERMSCEQKLHPLREKVGELTLKEQEARLQYDNGRAVHVMMKHCCHSGRSQAGGLQTELNRGTTT